MKKKKFLALTLIFFFGFTLSAQNQFSSEDDLKKQALQLFEEKKFVEATPLFAQLLSLYPKEAEYNFKYGACLLASNPDKEKAIKYLEFANPSSGISPLVHYYLGRAYHLNYDFAKAVKQYSNFKRKASSKEVEEYQVDRKIEMSKNGNQLLSKLNEVQVLDVQEIAEKDFFRVYKLEGINGKIISKPSDFQSKYDQKTEEKSVIFLPNDANEVYYSSYGKKGDNGKDIYKSIKLGNGQWSEGVSIGNSINTQFDEDYPFIHPDGRTLYFASKGHNSMGGYDLFKSTFDETTGQWLTPENLDFAFNSTSDDILFVTDFNQEIAYFASNRSNALGKVSVYKVLVERAPAELTAITGTFISEGNPNQKKAKITVIEKGSNNTVGVYETDANGKYLIEIPKNGGDYQFNIETTQDAPIHTGLVSIPKQDEFELLGQELRLVKTGDEQQLVIKNIFDGSIAKKAPSNTPIVSSSLLKLKSNLAVNFSENQLANLKSKESKEEATSQAKSQPVKTPEPSQSSVSDPLASKQSENLDKIKSDLAVLGTNFNKELEKQVALKNATYSQAIRYQEQAANQFNQATDSEDGKVLATKAAFTLEAAKEMEQNLAEVRADQQKFKRDSTDLSNLIDNQQTQEATKLAEELDMYSKLLLAKSNVNKVLVNKVNEATTKIKSVENELDKVSQREQSFSNEIAAKQEEISRLKNEFTSANGTEKTNLENQIKELELDLNDLAYQQNRLVEEKQQLFQNANALALKTQTLNDFSNQLEEDEASILASNADVSETAKNNLEQNLKQYQLSGQLAYEETSVKISEQEIAKTETPTAKEEPKQVVEPKAVEEPIEEPAILSSDEINQKYEIALEEAKNYTAKSRLYNEWEEELKSSLNQQEASVSASSGKEKKALQKEVKATKDQIKTVASERSKLKEEPAIAETPSPKRQVGSLSDINLTYTTSIEEIEKGSNPTLKQTQKEEIYTIWREDLENLMMAKEVEISKVESNEERNKLISEVNQIQLKIEEVAMLAQKMEETKDNLVVDFSTDISEIDDESIIPDDFTNFKFDQSIQYGNQRPSQTMAFAKKSLFEAGKIAKEAKEVSESAYTLPTVEERTAAFAKANDLKKLSEEKQLEAADYFAKYNREEYQINARRLENAQQYEDEFESTALDLAVLLSDEAESFFRNAAAIRSNINPNDRLSRKEVELQKAYDYEILAIEKQREAFAKLEIADDNYMKQAEITSNSSTAKFVQAINDEKILAITSPAVVETKIDSIGKENDRLKVKIAAVQNLINETPVGSERDSLIAVSETLSKEIKNNKTLAAVYYEREKQIYQGVSSAPQKRESPLADIIKPRSGNYDRAVAIDTIYVDDQRKSLLLKNNAFVEYAQLKAKQAGIMSEAEMEYKLAAELAMENQRLRKTAIIENNMIEMENDETERQRLVKSAEVIDLTIAKNESRIDSLNNRIKLKNLLISQSENQEKKLLSGLTDLEKQEFVSLAAKPEGMALAEERSTISPSNTQSQTGGGEAVAQETSAGNERADNLRGDTSTIPKIDVIDATQEIQEKNEEKTPLTTQATSSRVETEETVTTNDVEEEVTEVERSEPTTVETTEPIEQVTDNQVTETNERADESTDSQAEQSQNRRANTKTPAQVERKEPKIEAPVKVKETPLAETKTTRTTNVDVIPRQVKEAIFVTLSRDESAYGATKPIPVNTNLPEGLIYKVQVGAFRNPIPQNLFKGFAPIMAEETATGITRYTAGVFIEENTAISARNQIRQLGYPDAFVVAFLNGKRISMTQARGGAPAPTSESAGTSPSEGQAIAERAASKELSPVFAADNIEAVKSTAAIEKLFFTVQIGVFSKPVPKGKFNIKDLNVVEMPNGLIRYNAGIFDNAIDAGEMKLDLQNEFQDAFITAYYQGKRISINEAARLKNR
tara:strand:- start:6092 stop:11839 length:5748 start_codon:yes stop_codon:yes gene_type:complete